MEDRKDIFAINEEIEPVGGGNKPRIKYCWICGEKLALPYFVEKPIPKISGDDIPRIMHKSCYKKYEGGLLSTPDYVSNEKKYDYPEHQDENPLFFDRID